MTLRAAFVVSAALAVVVPSVDAWAQPPASAQEEAGSRFRRGVELFKEADFRAALIEFRRAHELAPNYRVLYNIGQCHLELQDYAGALRAYQGYLEGGGKEVPSARRSSVEATIARLQTRVAQVDLKVNVPGAEVRVDDELLGTSPFTSPVLVSAGRRRFVAEKSGMPTAVKTLDVAGGDHIVVSLTLQEPPKNAPPPVVVMAPPSKERELAPPPPIVVKEESNSSAIWIGWIATGVVAAGAVTTGVLALDAKKELDAQMAQYPGDQKAIDDASKRVKTMSIVTDSLAAAAIIGAGVSLYFTLSSGSSSSSSSGQARGTTRVGVGPSRLLLEGTF
jgi:hypothetical protein